MKKELKSQDGYDKYVKRLTPNNRPALELFCTSVNVPVKPKTGHLNKKRFTKADYIHAILAWVSIAAF